MAAADDSERSEDRSDDAVDRAFADLVAGYHLTADRAEPAAPAPAREPDREPTTWAADHPLFRYEETEPDEPEEVEERFVPPPPPPLPKPAWPVLLAWLGMGYAVLMVLAVVVGVRLPAWAGWLAVIGFVAGFGLLVTRLPRSRPPTPATAQSGAVCARSRRVCSFALQRAALLLTTLAGQMPA